MNDFWVAVALGPESLLGSKRPQKADGPDLITAKPNSLYNKALGAAVPSERGTLRHTDA